MPFRRHSLLIIIFVFDLCVCMMIYVVYCVVCVINNEHTASSSS